MHSEDSCDREQIIQKLKIIPKEAMFVGNSKECNGNINPLRHKGTLKSSAM